MRNNGWNVALSVSRNPHVSHALFIVTKVICDNRSER